MKDPGVLLLSEICTEGDLEPRTMTQRRGRHARNLYAYMLL
jgi:hypothetical protein